MNEQLVVELDNFVNRYVAAASAAPKMLQITYDADWPSSCYASKVQNSEYADWRPVKRDDVTDFTGMESALGITIHPDIVTFYGRYWSDNLNAKTSKGALQLLQAWNKQDFERLQENLIGHILMKRRLGQPETLFFALTDEDDFILTIDNQSGQVMLEQVGLLPQEVVAECLADFVATIEPDAGSADDDINEK